MVYYQLACVYHNPTWIIGRKPFNAASILCESRRKKMETKLFFNLSKNNEDWKPMARYTRRKLGVQFFLAWPWFVPSFMRPICHLDGPEWAPAEKREFPSRAAIKTRNMGDARKISLLRFSPKCNVLIFSEMEKKDKVLMEMKIRWMIGLPWLKRLLKHVWCVNELNAWRCFVGK